MLERMLGHIIHKLSLFTFCLQIKNKTKQKTDNFVELSKKYKYWYNLPSNSFSSICPWDIIPTNILHFEQIYSVQIWVHENGKQSNIHHDWNS